MIKVVYEYKNKIYSQMFSSKKEGLTFVSDLATLHKLDSFSMDNKKIFCRFTGGDTLWSSKENLEPY